MAKKYDLNSAELQTTTIKTDMDPRLQVLVARRRAGMTKVASASTDSDEVSVIARVTNFAAWRKLGEVREPNEIGRNGANEIIVTGRVPIHRVERVREHPFVLSLKAPRPMQPMLAATTQETLARPALLPVGHRANGGSGVVVGIIDYGGDFMHDNFRKNGGSTRLSVLWDQNGGNSPSSPFGYGQEHGAVAINMALKQVDPYVSLGYDPLLFDTGDGAHGTHVMDIAAGNGRGSNVAGMAPEAELVFVNVTHDRDPDSTGVVGQSFGDSVTLLEAIKYVFDKAGAKPCVINVSLGTNGGPHDGTTLLEQGIDSLLTAKPNRAVVIAASNSFEDGIHAAGNVKQGGMVDLRWQVAANLSRDIELEVWYEGGDRLAVDLIAPNGVLLASVAPGNNIQVTSGSQIAAFVANRLNDPNNDDNMIGVFLSKGMPGGTYIVRLRGDTIVNGGFHAWIERDNNFQSEFQPPHDNRHTIGSISCGTKLIAVGSYNAHESTKPLSSFSSAGPTRDGRQKPEVSAPGHLVWAARSGSKDRITQMSGTSMAAPAVAGLIALVFAEAKQRGLNLSIDQTRKIVIDCARRTPPAGSAWHDRYGHGRVSAAAAVQAVISLAGGKGGGGKSSASGANRGKKPAKRKRVAKRKK